MKKEGQKNKGEKDEKGEKKEWDEQEIGNRLKKHKELFIAFGLGSVLMIGYFLY